MAEAGAGPDQGDPAVGDAGAAAPAGPRPGPDWAGLPEDLLVKVAGTLVAQTEAEWAVKLQEWGWDEEEIQERMAQRKQRGNCLFVFALVCKEWRKAQLKVGGPLRTRWPSDVAMPGQVGLVKWALAEGCPKWQGMVTEAARYGHRELVQWLCGEGGFAMDKTVMKFAASSGNLELIQWLRGEGCPWDSWTCREAALKGHVEVLRWARENGCEWHAATRDRAAAELGYTDDLGNVFGEGLEEVEEVD